MQYAVCILGIQPQQFWAMTIKELMALLKTYEGGDEFILRTELENLQNQFPD
jgi:uncharacterized phage protein (TIGR02216 family)